MEALVRDLGDEFEFTLISDTRSLEESIEVLTPESLTNCDNELAKLKWLVVKNRKIGAFIWQSGAISAAVFSKFDAVICLGEFRIVSNWFVMTISKFRGASVFFWSHGVYGNEEWLKLRVRLAFYRLADSLFLYGHHAKRLLVEYGFEPKSIHVVFNSLDYENQKLIRNKPDHNSLNLSGFGFSKPTLPLLIFIGRLTKRKRVKLMLDAIRELDRRGTPVNLVVVGDGPERANLEGYTVAANLHNMVHFFGATHDENKLSAIIHRADLCVSPGDIGLLAMHCMVYGTPVVTHDNFPRHGPEFEAIIEGRTGSYFKNGEVHSLADEIKKWISLDDNQRSSVRQHCYDIIEAFYNPRIQTDVFKAVLNGVLPPDTALRFRKMTQSTSD